MLNDIEIHADDFGLFENQSNRIIECIDNGAVNSISIMPNSPNLKNSMKLLGNRDIKIAVHLNFVEGKAISPIEKISHLVDHNGIFNSSFFKLLAGSYIPFYRGVLKREAKIEIANQINATKDYVKENDFRIDGHCHYHMIPVVFDALMEVLLDENISVSYIRIPDESLNFYHKKGVREKIKFINIVKTCILHVLTQRAFLRYGAFLRNLEKRTFYGVTYSGQMNSTNAKYILDNLDLNERAEILFHPGSVIEEGDVAQLTNSDDIVFLTSENRHCEAVATKDICTKYA